MKPIIALWFILFLANLVAVPAVNYFFFNHVDARYEAYVRLVLVPLGQALVLAAAVRLVTARSVLIPLKAIGKPNAAGLFLLIDSLVLLLTLMPGLPQWMALNQSGGIADYFLGAKAIAAGILVVYGSFYRYWSDWERRSLMLIGVIICALGFDWFFPWLTELSRLVTADRALLLGWLLFYGPLFGLVMILMVRLETVWARRVTEAAFMVRYATIFLVIGTTIPALNVFNRQYLLEPWASVAKAFTYLGLSFLVAGSVTATRLKASFIQEMDNSEAGLGRKDLSRRGVLK